MDKSISLTFVMGEPECYRRDLQGFLNSAQRWANVWREPVRVNIEGYALQILPRPPRSNEDVAAMPTVTPNDKTIVNVA